MPRRKNRTHSERKRRRKARLQAEEQSSTSAGSDDSRAKTNGEENGDSGRLPPGDEITMGRRPDGTFGPGNQAAVGHGRPPKVTVETYQEALQGTLSPERLAKVVDRAIADATDGEDQKQVDSARKFLLGILRPSRSGGISISIGQQSPPAKPSKSKPPDLSKYPTVAETYASLVNEGRLPRPTDEVIERCGIRHLLDD